MCLNTLSKERAIKIIAKVLYRSRRTIEVHRASITCKNDVYNSVDLTKKAITMGLVSIKDNDNNYLLDILLFPDHDENIAVLHKIRLGTS